MPSIAGQAFITVPRLFERAKERVEVIERDGIDGSIAKKLGQRNNLTQVRCVVDRDNEAGLNTLELAMFALVSTVITVVDDHGKSWTNILVIDVRVGEAPRLGGLAVGGTTAGSMVAVFDFVFQDRDLV